MILILYEHECALTDRQHVLITVIYSLFTLQQIWTFQWVVPFPFGMLAFSATYLIVWMADTDESGLG